MNAGHELLTPVDAAWFRLDAADDPADVAAILFFDGPLDEARLRRTLETRLLQHHPRFRKRVVERGRFAPPEWRDDERFSLDAHIRHLDLEPGEDLAEVVSQLVTGPMSFEHPPWSWTILHGLPEGDAAFVRLHHCLGDGFALLDVLMALADTNGVHGAERPHPALALDRHVRGAARSFAHILAMRFDPATCLRGPLSGRRRVAWTAPLPLTDVKAAAHASRATVNDFLLAALSAALRRYLIAREGTASPIRAIVPVNLRPADAPVDLEKGNWFGLVFLDLPVDQDTRDRRLTALRRSMERLKRSKEAGVTLGILALMGRAPLVVDRIIEAIFSRKASVVVTNVPGPQSRLRLAGAPVRDIVFWVPHPAGLGLGISILSYAGRVRVGFRADTAIVPDPDLLARFFTEELSKDLPPISRKELHHEQRVT